MWQKLKILAPLVAMAAILCSGSAASAQQQAATAEQVQRMNAALAAFRARDNEGAIGTAKAYCQAGILTDTSCPVYAISTQRQVATEASRTGCYTVTPQERCVPWYREMVARATPVCDPPVTQQAATSSMCTEFLPKMRERAVEWSPGNRAAAPAARPQPRAVPSQALTQPQRPGAPASRTNTYDPNAADAGPPPDASGNLSRSAFAVRSSLAVTDADYPPEARRLGQEGGVTVRVAVSPQGRALSCRVAQSSGFPALDSGTCALVMQRGRFNSARNAQGAAISGEATARLLWKLQTDVQTSGSTPPPPRSYATVNRPAAPPASTVGRAIPDGPHAAAARPGSTSLSSANDEQGEDATRCVTSTMTRSGVTLYNSCPYTIEVTWCTENVDCDRGVYSNTWTIGANSNWQTKLGKPGDTTRFAACKGRNSLSTNGTRPFSWRHFCRKPM